MEGEERQDDEATKKGESYRIDYFYIRGGALCFIR